ncbi:MAG: hypothetical protein FWC77_08385 [Defluviitaleaceae bacterium]|nr:hypothetical protein [Defluviitaleaceae bacterium]
MSGLQIMALVILAVIVVPLPLAWLIGTLLPNGYTQAHTRRIINFFTNEWKRILLCGVVIWLVSVFSPDNIWRVVMVAVAILLGRFIAVSRSR